MRERFATSGMIALCALVVPGRVAAQHTRPVHVGVSGGVALVAGTNREFYRAGSTADLSVLVPIDAKGFSVRADLSVLHAPGKNQRRLLAPTGDSVTVGGLTART